jgi:hypothetical protein
MNAELHPIVLSTIGHLIDYGYRLSSWCSVCFRHGEIDLQALAARVGRDRSYLRPSLRFRCKECGTDRGQISPPMKNGFPSIQDG